jgi:hypothetical protein
VFSKLWQLLHADRWSKQLPMWNGAALDVGPR